MDTIRGNVLPVEISKARVASDIPVGMQHGYIGRDRKPFVGVWHAAHCKAPAFHIYLLDDCAEDFYETFLPWR